MNKWEIVKEKISDMIDIEIRFGNDEAVKAYYHVLKFMEVCEENE
jgi:hypothetical protein